MRGWVFLLIAAIGAGAGVLFWPKLESQPPIIQGPERIEVGAGGAVVDLVWTDEGMGLRAVSARLESGEGADLVQVDLHRREFAGSVLAGPVRPVREETLELDLAPASQPALREGDATLVLSARDFSWRSWGDGNRSEQRIPVRIDTTPPSLTVRSGLTYIRRGGAAAVVYEASADAVRSGIRVADAWFPGAPLHPDRPGDGQRVALFAIPIEGPASPEVEVIALDAFGNETRQLFGARIRERVFPETTIGLSDSFLERVGGRLGRANEMTEATPLATFQRVNAELRQKNESVIAAAIASTAGGDQATPQRWNGAFEQMKNSSVTSKFAELRHYTYGGDRVSRARHYGFDLASTAGAPITASNAGRVIFAGDNGIYGNLVLIDHGLGITSLYGHLSSLAVAVDDVVEKGQSLGQSGATGLAGGDHLHFAILVGETYVDPVEWWDPKWVREHLTVRLAPDPDPAG